jgi:predicted DNA-binding protein
MRETVRLNFEFPKEEYPLLKMVCADMGVSFKKFATDLVLKAVEEYEDHILAKKAHKRLKEMDAKDNISFDEAARLAGWKEDA